MSDLSIDLDDIDLDPEPEQVVDANAASEKQVEFARSLYRQVRDLGASQPVLDSITETMTEAKSSKSRMSTAIDSLIKIRDGLRDSLDEIPEGVHVHPDGGRRKVVRSKAGNLYALDLDATGDQYLGQAGLTGLSAETLSTDETDEPEQPDHGVPAGRYAVDGAEGQTILVKVDTPTEGDWAGYTFVTRLVGAPGDWRRDPVRNRKVRDGYLAQIAEDPKAASIRFGRESGRCGRCGSPLSDPASVAAGIGPVCAEAGW